MGGRWGEVWRRSGGGGDGGGRGVVEEEMGVEEVVGEGMLVWRVGCGMESKAPGKGGGGLLTPHTGRPGNSY